MEEEEAESVVRVRVRELAFVEEEARESVEPFVEGASEKVVAVVPVDVGVVGVVGRDAPPDDVDMPGAREFGGTSCTCRFRG